MKLNAARPRRPRPRSRTGTRCSRSPRAAASEPSTSRSRSRGGAARDEQPIEHDRDAARRARAAPDVSVTSRSSCVEVAVGDRDLDDATGAPSGRAAARGSDRPSRARFQSLPARRQHDRRRSGETIRASTTSDVRSGREQIVADAAAGPQRDACSPVARRAAPTRRRARSPSCWPFMIVSRDVVRAARVLRGALAHELVDDRRPSRGSAARPARRRRGRRS